jgi:ABC-type phosphonate transport system ATPase subunit
MHFHPNIREAASVNIIEIKNLTKYYGKSRGIEDVSFNVEEGGFLVLSGLTAQVSQRRSGLCWL